VTDRRPRIVDIFYTPEKGDRMRSTQYTLLEVGKGIVGDRYWSGEGAWSNAKRKIPRDVTLITLDGIRRANSLLAEPFEAHETRRNIILEGMSPADLNEIGELKLSFRLGDVLLEGVELAAPCERPSKLAGKPGFGTAFIGFAGIRARILKSGYIQRDDVLAWEAETAQG